MPMYACQLWRKYAHNNMKRLRVAYNAYRIMHCIPRNGSVRPLRVNHYVRIFDALYRNNLCGFVQRCASSSNFFIRSLLKVWCFLQIIIFPPLFNAPIWRWPAAVDATAGALFHWRSQPKILGREMFDFRRITLFCLEKRLSKHKMTIFSKIWGGMALLAPLTTPMRCFSVCVSSVLPLRIVTKSFRVLRGDSWFLYFLVILLSTPACRRCVQVKHVKKLIYQNSKLPTAKSSFKFSESKRIWLPARVKVNGSGSS